MRAQSFESRISGAAESLRWRRIPHCNLYIKKEVSSSRSEYLSKSDLFSSAYLSNHGCTPRHRLHSRRFVCLASRQIENPRTCEPHIAAPTWPQRSAINRQHQRPTAAGIPRVPPLAELQRTLWLIEFHHDHGTDDDHHPRPQHRTRADGEAREQKLWTAKHEIRHGDVSSAIDYPDLATLLTTMAVRRCGQGELLACRPYGSTHRLHRKYVHQQLGSKAAVSGYDALQEVAVGRFLWRLMHDEGRNLVQHLYT